ncbi:2Fe-2S iron-sulfur cluster binding domain-containing protein [bacterium]|nr:MAG: 2Fe-2S iron-sulfur cluster binding domain-containing protein [bacterium]
MPEIIIDDKKFTYDTPGKVLPFILDHGMDLPFFCYHPSLSIPANCRQCLVEIGTPVFDRATNSFKTDENGEKVIQFFPKLMTACSQDMSDGMVVKTHVSSEKVRRAQKDTLEFILVNHPLDCPICDQAGECPLQIQTYKYGPEGSRFEYKKVHKPKRIQLGPRVVLDAERCINCTRCVRFTHEISKTYQLSIVSRGDKNYPSTANGKEFDDAYSLNTVDICPVGALTQADFRFKARVWEMNQTPSIDITNGKGTNVDLWVRDNLVLRLTPRHNPHVNDYWMPDSSREAYRLFNENRISRPEIKLDKELVKTSWNNAKETIAEIIEAHDTKEVLVLGSGYASVEENFVFNQFFTALGCGKASFVPHVVEGAGDGFLLTDDQAPNTKGCELLGFRAHTNRTFKNALAKATVVVVLAEDIVGRELANAEDLAGKTFVYFGTNNNTTSKDAQLVVPITCAAEHAASYVNVDGRIQRTFAAKETVYTSRATNLEMSTGRLDRFGTKFDNWRTDKNKVDCLPVWEFLSELAPRLNQTLSYETGKEVLTAVSSSVDAFAGVDYDKMDTEMGVVLSTPETEEKTA